MRIPYHAHATRPPAHARRQLRRRYPGTLALLAAWGDEDAERALATIDPGGSRCSPTGACS